MSFGIVAASVIGAGAGIYASNKASKAQQQSAAQANALAKETKDEEIALQREMFDKNVELQKPAIDAGNTARNQLLQLLGLTAGGADNGSLARDFTMADFQADPGYQFRLAEGMKGLERSAAARGGLLSGGAMKDMARFTQGLGAQEYQAAYDRFNSNKATRMNPLLSLAGSAQTASGALGAAGQSFANSAGQAMGNYASTAGQNITGAGNARASGYVGAANAIGNGISQGFNGYQQNQLLGLLNRQNQISVANRSTDPLGSFIDQNGWSK